MEKKPITRRDFIRGATCAALGTAAGLSFAFGEEEKALPLVRAVLVRHKDAVDAKGAINSTVIQQMMDDAVTALFDVEKPIDAWKLIIIPDDVVGIKSNVSGPPSTPDEVEQALTKRIIEVGVSKENLDIMGTRNSISCICVALLDKC